jgi:hypothetical protein
MGRMAIFALALSLLAGVAHAAEPGSNPVRNVAVSPEEDGRYVVTYDLDAPKAMSVRLTGRAGNFVLAINQTDGDVGDSVAPGAGKRIVWESREDYPEGLDPLAVVLDVQAEPLESGETATESPGNPTEGKGAEPSVAQRKKLEADLERLYEKTRAAKKKCDRALKNSSRSPAPPPGVPPAIAGFLYEPECDDFRLFKNDLSLLIEQYETLTGERAPKKYSDRLK